jgi:hypothetical protein
MGPAVVSTSGFSHYQSKDIRKFLDGSSGFESTFKMLQDAGGFDLALIERAKQIN